MDVWVSCFKPKGSQVYYIQIRHRDSGKIIATRSTRQRKKRDADRVTPEIVAEVLEQGDEKPEVLTFSEFCERYTAEEMLTQADSTRDNMRSTMNRIKRELKPTLLKGITAARISKFRSDMISEGLSMYSVRRNLSNLRKLLNWGKQMGYLSAVPHIKMPTKKELIRQKGRAISTEEFERILKKIPQEVGKQRESDWRYFLRGIWLSGLRLGEAVRLSWDDGNIQVDLTSQRPRFKILKDGQKNRKASRHPMTPDFFELLMETPDYERTGFVFHPSSKLKPSCRYTAHTAGKIVSSLGELAGVKAGKGRGGKQRFASSHDFRRSFGTRWARMVEPDELRRLMRHDSLETTMDFYVDGVDDDLAESVWEFATEDQNLLLEG